VRSSSASVSITVDDTDPRDPAARCDQCGTLGTIARAVRHTAPQLVLRYCSRCWPAWQEEHEARQREEHKQWQQADRAWAMRAHNPQGAPASQPLPPPAWTCSSRSWYDAQRFLALITQPVKGGPAPTPDILAAIALEIRAKAAEMDGPMPPEVKDFLARHAPPSA